MFESEEGSWSEWIAESRLDGGLTPVVSIEVEMVVRTHRHILYLSEPIRVKDNRHEEEENVTKGRKRKGTSSPNACESASFGRPWADQWISLQASTHRRGSRGGAESRG